MSQITDPVLTDTTGQEIVVNLQSISMKLDALHLNASNVSYDNSLSSLDATNVQNAIDALEGISGKSPRINSSGIWEVWDASQGAYVSTGYSVMVNPPKVAATASAMTNHDYVYIYTGSESGYQNGYWYYWNGSAWTAGGAYQVAATDKTLTISNAPADSKATGDNLTQLKSALGDIVPLPALGTVTNGYISCDGSAEIGDTISMTPVSATNIGNIVVDVHTGEKYIATGQRPASGKCGWFTVDSSNKLVEKSGTNSTYTNVVIEITVDGKLVSNYSKLQPHSVYKGTDRIKALEDRCDGIEESVETVDEKVDNLKNDLNTIIPYPASGESYTNKNVLCGLNTPIGTVIDLTPTTATNFGCIVIDVLGGDKYTAKGQGPLQNCGWFTVDASDKLVSKSTTRSYEQIIEIEADGKLVLNYSSLQEHYVEKGTDRIGILEKETAKIDDSAGAGTTDKTWSANKLYSQFTSANNAIESLEGGLSVVESAVNGKVNRPVSNPYGTSGQVLRTNGDGSTTWATVGQPTDEQTEEAINAWLNAHPEAVTTVEDGSITVPKIAPSAAPNILNDYLTPLMYGAVGDGVEDDSQALLDCASACSANNKLLYLPPNYTLNIPAQIEIANVYHVRIDGTIKAANGIVFRGLSSSAAYNWEFYRINGELILEGIKASIIKVVYADTLKLVADSKTSGIGSIAYNMFLLGHTQNVYLHGIGNGWINENFFYNGKIQNLTVDGNYSHNNNHFYHCSFEAATIDFYCGYGNYIHDARFEGSYSITFHENAGGNLVQKVWQSRRFPSIVFAQPFNDLNGTNLFMSDYSSPTTKYEKLYNADSYNYDVDSIYPAQGQLHSTANEKVLETKKISINNGITVRVKSDAAFFKVRVYVYDENGDAITEEPSESPAYPNNLTWNSSGYFSHSSDIDDFSYVLSARNVLSHDQTGIAFVKIVVISGTSADFDYLRIAILASSTQNLNPFKNDIMQGSSAPLYGEWIDGNIIYNRDGTQNVAGWYYLNNAWHTIPFTV